MDKFLGIFLSIFLPLQMSLCEFEEDESVYLIEISSSDGGTVSNEGGLYAVGDEFTTEALPESDFLFQRWSDGRTDNPLSFTVDDNVDLEAIFFESEINVDFYVIGQGSIQVNTYHDHEENADTIPDPNFSFSSSQNISKSFHWGDRIQVEALPNQHYDFFDWVNNSFSTGDDNVVINSTQSETILYESQSISAEFIGMIVECNIYCEFEGTDNDRGDVIFDKITYRYGDSLTVSAAPDLNWKFKDWTNGSTQNPYRIILNEEMVNAVTVDSLRMDLMVRWAPKDSFVNVEILSADGGDVSITKNREGSGYKEGDIITINALPNEGNRFTSWSDGNESPERTIEVGENNIILTASFSEIPTQYALSLTAGTGGSVSGGGTYDTGSSVDITATPDSGYTFTSWSDGSTDATRTVTVSSATSLTASFSVIQYALSLTAGTGGSVSGGGTYDTGSSVDITATPDSGYTFTSWSDGSTDATRTVTVSSATSLTASFSAVVAGGFSACSDTAANDFGGTTTVAYTPGSAQPDLYEDSDGSIWLFATYINAGQGITNGTLSVVIERHEGGNSYTTIQTKTYSGIEDNKKIRFFFELPSEIDSSNLNDYRATYKLDGTIYGPAGHNDQKPLNSYDLNTSGSQPTCTFSINNSSKDIN